MGAENSGAQRCKEVGTWHTASHVGLRIQQVDELFRISSPEEPRGGTHASASARFPDRGWKL